MYCQTTTLENSGQARRLEMLACLGVFCVSFLSCWLFSLAYPESIFNEETPSYLTLGHSFKLLAPNAFDWCVTPPYPALLTLLEHFPNPSHAAYALNAILFSINMSATFFLGRLLLNSIDLGIALAMGMLAFEIAVMRIFYGNLLLCCDPFIAELIYLGVLLAFIGWLRSSGRELVIGYALLGLSCLIKPVGMSLLPAWIVFALATSYSLPNKKRRMVTAIVSLALLTAPLFLWSLRNYFVYGNFKASAVFGTSLLRVVFPLLEYDDHLFADQKLNQKFIDSVRACEDVGPYPRDINLPIKIRSWRNEDYFIYGGSSKNPFVVLADVIYPGWPGNRWSLDTLDGRLLFKLDAVSYPLALKIIRAHPLGYIKRVAREYVDIFNPSAMSEDSWDTFDGDPEKTYGYWRKNLGKRPINFQIFPQTGIPNGSSSNKQVCLAFKTIFDCPIIANLRTWYFAVELILSHLIFLAAVACLFFARAKGNLHKFSVVVIMLFLSAALPNFGVALCQVDKSRYALLGEMELHLLFLITALTLATHLISLAKTCRSQNSTDMVTQ